MEKTEFVNRKTLHHLVVDKVYRFLVKESKSHIINNTPSRNKRYWARLKLYTGEHVYPDIVDVDNKLVYEIHIKGENRREYFDKLSDRWKGINVFIEEAHSPETLVVKVGKFGGFKAKRIAWRVRKKERYIDAVKPMISQISEQIAKGEIFEVGTKDIVKQIGLFDDDIADVVCGLMYVLFDDGYYVSRSGEKIMIRKKKEGDILPDYLPEYMEQWEEFEDDTKKVLFR